MFSLYSESLSTKADSQKKTLLICWVRLESKMEMMMTEKTKVDSILGDFSQYYLVKTQEGGGILDDPYAGKLEMYPAGYTYQSNRDGRTRQNTYQILWEAAVANKKETDLYPFGLEGHALELVRDTNNTADHYATHLILRVSSDSKYLPKSLDGVDLGFVPKKINQQILKNLNKVH